MNISSNFISQGSLPEADGNDRVSDAYKYKTP